MVQANKQGVLMSINLKPGAANREDILRFISSGLVEHREYWSGRLVLATQRWEHYDRLGSYGVSLCSMFNHSMNVAVSALIEGSQDIKTTLSKAVAYGFWMIQLEPHLLRQMIEKEGEFDFSHPDINTLCCAYGVLSKVGLEDVVDWLSPYLKRSFDNPYARDTIVHQDLYFARFMAELMRIKVDGKWPDDFDKTRFGDYYPLLSNARSAQKFKDILPAYCDFRWANVLGYESVDAKRRRRADEVEDSMFYGKIWRSLIPFELFTLQYVFQSVTGESLSLYAEHELLQRKYLELPRIESDIYQDEWTRKAKKAGDKFLKREDWQYFDIKGLKLSSASEF